MQRNFAKDHNCIHQQFNFRKCVNKETIERCPFLAYIRSGTIYDKKSVGSTVTQFRSGDMVKNDSPPFLLDGNDKTKEDQTQPSQNASGGFVLTYSNFVTIGKYSVFLIIFLKFISLATVFSANITR